MTGDEAIERAKTRIESGKCFYKLILMDYSLPGMNGPTCAIALSKLMQERRPKDELPYLCFLTAYSEKSFRDKAAASGADSYIIKPIFKQNLHKLLIKANFID